jgi:transposase
MVWTEITRRHYRREGLRYESDTTDAEWFVMEPLLPEASALGRPRATDMRTVMNAILCIESTGCQWRQLPKDFPPWLFLCVVPRRNLRFAELQSRYGVARGGWPRGDPNGRRD